MERTCWIVVTFVLAGCAHHPVCSESDEVLLAGVAEQRSDPSVASDADPCEDFQAFVCEPRRSPPQDGFPDGRPSDRVRLATYERLADVWADDPGLPGQLYRLCVDEVARDEAGLAPFQHLFAMVDAVDDRGSFLLAAGRLWAAGIPSLFKLIPVGSQSQRPGYYMAMPRGVPIDAEYFASDDPIAHRVVDRVGAVGTGFVESTPEATLEWYRAVADAQLERPREWVRGRELKELQSAEWAAFWRAAGLDPKRLWVHGEHYLERLFELVGELDPALSRDLLRRAILHRIGELLPAPHRDSLVALKEARYGIGLLPLEPSCAAVVTALDPSAAEEALVSPEDRPRLAVQLEASCDVFSQAAQAQLLAAPWATTAPFREHVRKRIEMLRCDAPVLAGRPAQASPLRETLGATLLVHHENRARRDRESIEREAMVEHWSLGPVSLGAGYAVNNHVVLLGTLTLAELDRGSSLPDYLGGPGFVLGHEISHAIDIKQVWGKPRSEVRMVWPDAIKASYRTATQCLTDSVTASGVSDATDRSKYDQEVVADLLGLRASHATLMHLDRACGGETSSIEDRRALFVAFAERWCSTPTPENAFWHSIVDVHPADASRVNAVVRQMHEFAAAFSCTPTDAMVASKRCGI